MKRYKKLLILLISAVLLINVDAVSHAASTQSCNRYFNSAQQGNSALVLLNDNVASVAQLNRKSEQEFRQLLKDPSYWLDECGLAFYVDSAAPQATTISNPETAPFAYDQTFLLHSKPGSTKTIYLDFNGHTVSGTAWNSYFNLGSTYNASGYSQDADYTTFNNAEMDVIQSVWQRVSEDYAPFDVDITTEFPAAGVLERSSSTDNVYGTRAVVTDDANIQSKCKCGGIAYVGVFNIYGTSHEDYQPAWIFTAGVGKGAKNITEALSHEVGHNLGLSHDGKDTAGYYVGTAGWAPIMGVGYYEGLTQWSRGEYTGATNTEDDFAVMSSYGAVIRADEDSNSAASSRVLNSTLSGIIASDSDEDWFTFTPGASGDVTITANPAPTSPNLDIQMSLYRSTDLVTPVASNNPTMVDIATDSIGGLNAAVTYTVAAGTTYYVKVEGVGNGDPLSTGYSGYGSVGNYQIVASGITQLLSITTQNLPNANTATNYSAQLAATGGVSPYTWSKVSGSTWVNVSSAGVVSGLAPSTGGTSTVSVALTDNAGTQVTKSFNISVINNQVTISTASLPNASTRKSYSATLTAVGGSGTGYTWSRTSGNLPTGFTLSTSGTISGTTSTKGNFTFTVKVVDSVNNTVSKTFTIKVL